MTKFIFILFLSVIIIPAFGQIALIDDPDGFTNVRKEKNVNSEILYQVKSNEVFFIDIEYLDLDSSWIKVWIPTDKFSKHEKDYSNSDISGFIHKSRIKLIDELQIVESEIQKADTTKKLINAPYGLEIELSDSYQIAELQLDWFGEIILQEKVLFDDLYNVSFETGIYSSDLQSFTTYKNNDTYFIRQKCADGSGYYEIVWVIENGKIIQRLAGWIT